MLKFDKPRVQEIGILQYLSDLLSEQNYRVYFFFLIVIFNLLYFEQF